MSKPITVKDLLAQKDKLKKKKLSKEKLYIASLDGYIVIQEPTREIALEALNMTQGANADKADAYVVYHSVVEPNLKDQELQETFGCVEPLDIVDKIFKGGEVTAISGHSLALAGYGDGVKKLDKEIKN